ncbi:hypothetical protein P7C70_g8243, partial [Phenoliferia sp. Uapishka_3]
MAAAGDAVPGGFDEFAPDEGSHAGPQREESPEVLPDGSPILPEQNLDRHGEEEEEDRDMNMDFGGGGEDQQQDEEPAGDEDDEDSDSGHNAAQGEPEGDEEFPEADEVREPSPEPARALPRVATAPKAQRIVPPPPIPCDPPSRELPRDVFVRTLFYEMAVDHAMGANLIERIRWFLEQIGVKVEGVESWHMLCEHAFELSELELVHEDQCAGHTSSGNPATKDWRVCEAVIERDNLPDIICGRTRYLPLNTANLASLRKNSQKLGQKLPPLNKVPRDQHTHCSIGPFVDAIYANPIQSADLLRANAASIKAALTDSDRIDSFETGEMARKLFNPAPSGLCTANDMLLSTTSDGADIYPMSTPNSAVNAHLAGVRIPALTDITHRFLYVAGVNGPIKGPATLYLHTINADLEKLEVPKVRYVAAIGALASTRVFNALNTSDTVEQCQLSGTVGQTGKCPSMSHTIRGVYNVGLSRWQHPLLAFRCAPEDEAFLDNRPDVWTNGNPVPLPGLLGPHFVPRVRHIQHYDKIIGQLEDDSINKTKKAEITTESGITGRSIYDSLGIFRWVYPWIFSLDDMHVTYSNNMKHFLEAIFGKDAEKPTLRGVMIDSIAHRRMAEALGRTIHLQPAAHGQKVRGIEHIGRLKAAELRSFLWFHLASLMHGVAEEPKDMDLVVSAIRSSRITNHRVILRDAPYNPRFCTYIFNDKGEFPVPFANIRRAIDDHLLKRERMFVGRQYEYGGTCVASHIRAHALPDMALKWGAGLLATTQWGLEGKIGDIKRNVKSRTLPVKNMENNNIDMNILTLIHFKYDVPVYQGPVKPNLREQHPRIADTTFLHTKTEKARITADESKAIEELLARNRGLSVGTKQPTQWQRVQLANREIIGSIGREYGTELGRIISEDDVEDDMMQKEREGIRRATRFCKRHPLWRRQPHLSLLPPTPCHLPNAPLKSQKVISSSVHDPTFNLQATALPPADLRALLALRLCWLDVIRCWRDVSGGGILSAAARFSDIAGDLGIRTDRFFYMKSDDVQDMRSAFIDRWDYNHGESQWPELQEDEALDLSAPQSSTPTPPHHLSPSPAPLLTSSSPPPPIAWDMSFCALSPASSNTRRAADQRYQRKQLAARAQADAEGRVYVEFSDEEEPDTQRTDWEVSRLVPSRSSSPSLPPSGVATRRCASDFGAVSTLTANRSHIPSPSPGLEPHCNPSSPDVDGVHRTDSSDEEPETESEDEVDKNGVRRTEEEVCLRYAFNAAWRTERRFLGGEDMGGYVRRFPALRQTELARGANLLARSIP